MLFARAGRKVMKAAGAMTSDQIRSQNVQLSWVVPVLKLAVRLSLVAGLAISAAEAKRSIDASLEQLRIHEILVAQP